MTIPDLIIRIRNQFYPTEPEGQIMPYLRECFRTKHGRQTLSENIARIHHEQTAHIRRALANEELCGILTTSAQRTRYERVEADFHMLRRSIMEVR